MYLPVNRFICSISPVLYVLTPISVLLEMNLLIMFIGKQVKWTFQFFFWWFNYYTLWSHSRYIYPGRWILHENYIHDSFSEKAWLNEEAYEWNTNMCQDLAASAGRETLLPIPKQCRIAYSGISQGPFVNWNVALVCDKSKQPTYKRSVLLWSV